MGLRPLVLAGGVGLTAWSLASGPGPSLLVGASLAALVTPGWSLAAFMVVLPLAGIAPGGPRQAGFDLLLVGLLAGLGLHTLLIRRPGAPRSALRPAVWAVLGSAFLASWPLRYVPPDLQLSGLLPLARHLLVVGDDAPEFALRGILAALIGGALFFPVARQAWLGAHEKIRAGIALGVVSAALAGLLDALGVVSLRALRPVSPELVGRLYSVFLNPGWLGQYMVVATAVLLPRALAGGQPGTEVSRPLVWLERLGFAAAMAAAMASAQRGAWLALLAMGVTFAWARRRHISRARLFVFAALVLAGAALLPGVRARARNVGADLSRVQYWAPSLAMFAERPLLGQGVGTFAAGWRRRAAPGTEAAGLPAGEAHNAYLMLLAERGAVGLLCYLGLLYAVARSAWRRGDLSDGLVVVGLAVYGLVQYPFYCRAVELLVWAALGLVAAKERPGPAATIPVATRWRVAPVVAGGFVAAILVWRSLDPAMERIPGPPAWGFHLPEGEGAALRWTYPEAAVELAALGELLELEVADGRPGSRTEPLELRAWLDGRPLEPQPILVRGSAWHRLSWYAPTRDDGAGRVLRLSSSVAFRPADLAPTLDVRLLGVAVRTLEVRDLPVGADLGFYRWEESDGIFFRWSRGRIATLCLGDRGGRLVLPLRAPDPAVAERPLELAVSIDGQGSVARLALRDNEWTELELDLPPDRERTVVTIEADRAFTGTGADQRLLGFGLAQWKVRGR